ncbi:hypothetical protein DRF65_18500 [Chryseobacterium pennae]|uniref:Uncharacterized protein n=1 Tax=Chryseobacterium pennae TaxID=2258962 RepID=A0A3D9C527_9FLAO|nr:MULTISPECIES: hypothetical protein [Chryseobacterium]REC60798.1 hypothetical protein DRF65_18500 [Chryseobacterium pennae]
MSKKIDDNLIVLKFSNHQYFDLENDIYELNIFGNEVAKSIDLIKKYNLNTETVIVDEINELDFFVGNMDESPDWGDWNGNFSMTFERYSGQFSEKTQEDWENELMFLIGDQVRTKAFQSVIDVKFRSAKFEQTKKMIIENQIEPKIQDNLILLLNKIQNLDDGEFYHTFMNR